MKATAALIGKERIIGIARNLAKAQGLDIEIRRGDDSNRQEFEQALDGVNAVWSK